jgi:hypothetical protein
VTNSLVVPAHSSTTRYTGFGLVEDAAQVAGGIHSHSWVDGSLGGVGTSLDVLGAVTDPLGSLVAWGVSWLMEHVKPLQEALDWLAGNPDEIAAHAATWQNVAQFSAGAGAQYAEAVNQDTAGWQGDSGAAYRRHAGAHVTVLQGISQAAHGISSAVEGAGLLVGLVRGIVRDLIAQFVATLAARLPQWLAEEGVTLGIGTPVVIGQVAALVAKWVEKIQHFLRGLLTSLRKLTSMVDRLGQVLADLRAELARLLRSGATEAIPGGSGEIPPPRSGNHLPTDARLVGRLRGENDPTNPYRAFYPHTVHYMTPAEREEHRLFVDADGHLRSAGDGRLYDTTSGVSAWSGGGQAIFVMDGSGNLYATLDQRVGHTHHSSLLGGEPVAGAGEIEVEDGRLVSMTNQSGHYRPTMAMNDRVLRSLREQGLVTGPGFRQYGLREEG